MTTMHFKALATILKSRKPKGNHDTATWRALDEQWAGDVHAVALVAADFNPRFNREKFFKAAGLDD